MRVFQDRIQPSGVTSSDTQDLVWYGKVRGCIMCQSELFGRERAVMELTHAAKHTFVDLFAGAGGMSLGLVRAGLRPVYAVESDTAAAETYRANFGDHVFAGDIALVEAFPRADVIIGGPPCQGFSQLGTRNPGDPRNSLWRHYVRAIEEAHPKIFVMENVPQLLASDHFLEFRAVAEQLGYELCWGVLDASQYGVPQRRKRAFIIGSRVGAPSLPAQIAGRATVRDAIADLPLEPTGANLHIGRNPTPMSLERYRNVPEGGNHYDLPDALKPECWRKKKSGTTDVMGRLRWDAPSCTIRTEFYKPEKGRYLHPVADRPITHREAARLQTFPDDFVFCGSKTEVARQIGNAVPVLLAQAIGEHVVGLLEQAENAREAPREVAAG